ncbi:MAG TPA: universal stress protein [Nitrosopumilaceae archaeon]|nr:universal stress protein [Nitrosopumilaceae archaeon]
MKKPKTKNLRMPKSKIRKILIPIDGSKPSFRALSMGINLAKFTRSAIIILHVLPTGVSSLSVIELLKPLSSIQSIGFEEKLKKRGQKIIDTARLRCKQNDLKFTSKLLKGNPGYDIIKFAHNKKNSVDLIIMGSSGEGHAEEILLGSVSYHVVHKSKIPVLMIK